MIGQKAMARAAADLGPVHPSIACFPVTILYRPRMSAESSMCISVRGGVAFWPVSSGHWFTLSIGGRPASAASLSVY